MQLLAEAKQALLPLPAVPAGSESQQQMEEDSGQEEGLTLTVCVLYSV